MKASAWAALGISVFHVCWAVPVLAAQDTPADTAASEAEYLGDVPTVISVSRIAQSLQDTPGAVTILDREFIRTSGARDVVGLLAFVPGFQTTTSYETDAPMATYHGRTDDFANRIQVLVDGRSVYSGLLDGSAGMGWKALALDDIDRIEILRGSNSATYGSRAFLGVVNIISRDTRETMGPAAQVTNGENGIVDQGMRYGWADRDATYRISADSTGDNGLQYAFGRNYTERFNFSSHLGLTAADDLELRAGAVGVYAGRGTVGDMGGNPARMRFMGSQFVQADWHEVVDDKNDLAVSYSHTENTDRDHFPYLTAGTYYMTTIDFSGVEYVDRLTVQRSTRMSASLRTVIGGELSQERDVSPSSFDKIDQVTTDFSRIFGSAEWRLSSQWLLNVGALAEHNDLGGDDFAPRLMLNWQLAPGSTIRFGGSTAFRPPSAYEKYARVQYYDVNGQNPTGYYVYNNGTLQSEKLVSKELGYLYTSPDKRTDIDVRAFNEMIIDGIAETQDFTPGSDPQTFLNSEQYQINGVEWQSNWRPSPDTRIFFSQTWTNIMVSASIPDEVYFRTLHSAPRYASSLTMAHTFDSGVEVSVMYQGADAVALMSISNNPWLYSMERTDLRIAKPFRVGQSKVQLALTVQNLNNPYADGDRKFFFDQRAMLSLKIDN